MRVRADNTPTPERIVRLRGIEIETTMDLGDLQITVSYLLKKGYRNDIYYFECRIDGKIPVIVRLGAQVGARRVALYLAIVVSKAVMAML